MDRGEIIIYQTADGETRLDVRMENDSVWLTQVQIAQLFGTETPAISKHIRNISQSGELEREATVSEMVRPLIWKEIIFIYSIFYSILVFGLAEQFRSGRSARFRRRSEVRICS